MSSLNASHSYGGVLSSYLPFFVHSILRQREGQCFVIVCESDEDIDPLKDQLLYLRPSLDCLPFKGFDVAFYDRLSPSGSITQGRLRTLMRLLDHPPQMIITSIRALIQKVPPRLSLLGESLTLDKGKAYSLSHIIQFLSLKGYHRCETVYEVGDYAVRGSLLDVFAMGEDSPVRLDFFDQILEAIRSFDVVSQITQGTSLDKLSLLPLHEFSFDARSIESFKEKYPKLSPLACHDSLYQYVLQGRYCQGVEHFLSCFYEALETFWDYVEGGTVIVPNNVEALYKNMWGQVEHLYEERLTTHVLDHVCRALPPKENYVSPCAFKEVLSKQSVISFSPYHQLEEEERCNVTPVPVFIKNSFQEVIDVLTSYRLQKIVVITSLTEGQRHTLLTLLNDYDIKGVLPVTTWPSLDCDPSKIYLIVSPLRLGFIDKTHILISEEDIWGSSTEGNAYVQPKPLKKSVFFDRSHFQLNDLLVHKEHGVGRYLGLETVVVEAISHDCLSLLYANDTKLLVPIEFMDLVSRYGNESSHVVLDRLGSAGWQMRKVSVKKKLLVIAFELVRLAANRALQKASTYEIHTKAFDEFCARFQHVETEDQKIAIEATLGDLESSTPMDRLICADVGFGKTEIALRSAFIVAYSGKQVALIAPTTLLVRQHYHAFKERFKNTDLVVEQLSRLISPKKSKEIKDRLAKGEVSIIVATHALLDSKLVFHDLGLLIVDEEQRFGVKQKERLKNLRENIHVLTLSATPIPRTLQLAMSGVRDLSLITTPPINRLSVKTFVIPFDALVIREAILREIQRGGQVFYVTPRIDFLNTLTVFLKELIPDLRFKVAHGKMPSSEMEDVMNEFYDHAFDLLLTTHIIESGIDIPTANTLLVDRSDLFGLSQLHQIRGRVGRSKTQGYAYLLIPNEALLTSKAKERLSLLQSIDSLGAGFTLASHDLDIRGAGNIVGSEQSGHIKEVGIELYQHLLEEAVAQAKAELSNTPSLIENPAATINLGVSVLIPQSYINDLSTRLEIYRRIADVRTEKDLMQIAKEIVNRFGPYPYDVRNLIDTVRIKRLCESLSILKFEANAFGMMISFQEPSSHDVSRLIPFIQSKEAKKFGNAKIRPDKKLHFAMDLTDDLFRVKVSKILLKTIKEIFD